MPRRRTFLAALPLLASGHAAWADEPPAAAPALPPVPPLATTPTLPQPGGPVPPRPPPAPAPAPHASAPPASAPIDRTKAYYVYFDQNIDIASMRALRRQCTALAEAGVAEITLVVHSAGGLVDPTLTTYGFLRALPCTINTHALGFVASAANVLFLVGERRSANRNCRFLFHPTTAPITGSMSGRQMRDRVVQFDAVANSIAEIYRDRTTFTDEELARFAREEVIYTAQQAHAGGMVQVIEDLRIPDASKARVLFLD